MIKTQTKEECILLREIMPEYMAHLIDNPDSLLVRFYGMHRLGVGFGVYCCLVLGCIVLCWLVNAELNC